MIDENEQNTVQYITVQIILKWYKLGNYRPVIK